MGLIGGVDYTTCLGEKWRGDMLSEGLLRTERLQPVCMGPGKRSIVEHEVRPDCEKKWNGIVASNCLSHFLRACVHGVKALVRVWLLVD